MSCPCKYVSDFYKARRVGEEETGVERNILHGEKTTKGEEELADGGPFPMASEAGEPSGAPICH